MRPRGVRDLRHQAVYLFGAVCPARDAGVVLVLPAVSAAAMQAMLDELSQAVSPGAQAVVLMDRAGWHIAKELTIPPNLTPLFLPPYSPELNAIERLWLYLRERFFSHRLWPRYDDILDACCALVRMLSAIEPNRDWGPLARVYNHLRQTAAPSRDKLSRLVRASDLFELGVRLMETCEERSDRPGYEPTRYRDGLIIALLISCPIRLKNLTGLVVGQHLVSDGRDYRLTLTAAETKTGRPYVAMVPPGGP